MSQVRLNLFAKNLDPSVKYQPFNPIQINNESIGINNVNFHIPTLLKEVKKTPKKELKEYRRNIKTFLATLSTSFLILPLKSMASTSQNAVATTTTNLPQKAEGIPPELLAILLKLLVIAVGSGVILAAILLVIAGAGRMFKMKGTTSWTTDILKGLFQILAAVPVVFLVYYLANLIFKGSGWFISPF